MSCNFLCIIKFYKIANYANPYIFLKLSLMRMYSYKNKVKKIYHNSKNLNGFKDLYSSMCALHVWPGKKYQRNSTTKKYHMRHTALTWRHLIIICLGQWSTRFAICSSPTFNMSENGSVTFLPPSQPRSTIQGSETYEKDARAQ